MSDCIFCQIVKGDIPCHKVYESDSVLAFLDIHPISRGHTLVIPKIHYSDFINTPPDVVADLMTVVQELAPAIMETVLAPAFNIGVNTGSQAGQVIFHTHIHLMPRFNNDGLKMWTENSEAVQSLPELAKKITEKII